MITSLCPISESVVAVGSSESSLRLVRFPNSDLLSSLTWSGSERLVKPLPLLTLGNCSHYAITSMDHDMSNTGPSCLVAAAGSSVLTWDILKGQRQSTYSCNGQYYACTYLAPNLIGAAGSDRSINLYDTRSKSGARPIWSMQVLSDNLYTIAKSGQFENNLCSPKIYLAGAAGLVYGIDLRAGTQEIWDMPRLEHEVHFTEHGSTRNSYGVNKNIGSQTNAILDLSWISNLLVAIRENGEVVGFSTKKVVTKEQHRTEIHALASGHANYYFEDKGPFLFSHQVMGSTKSRTSCDTRLNDDGSIDIVTGSENGTISVLAYDEDREKYHLYRQIKVTSDLVLAVHWAKYGVYFGASDNVGLIMYN